jgi:hypothetical protein
VELKVTEEQGKELTDYVEKQALERIKTGALQSEADFYLGAASVLQYLFGKDPKELTEIVPPMWIIGIMSGRSPSTRWEEDGLVRGQHETKLERQSRLYQNAELMYEFACDVFQYKDRNSYEGRFLYTPQQILNEMEAHARIVLEDIGLYDFWPDEEE